MKRASFSLVVSFTINIFLFGALIFFVKRGIEVHEENASCASADALLAHVQLLNDVKQKQISLYRVGTGNVVITNVGDWNIYVYPVRTIDSQTVRAVETLCSRRNNAALEFACFDALQGAGKLARQIFKQLSDLDFLNKNICEIGIRYLDGKTSESNVLRIGSSQFVAHRRALSDYVSSAECVPRRSNCYRPLN